MNDVMQNEIKGISFVEVSGSLLCDIVFWMRNYKAFGGSQCHLKDQCESKKLTSSKNAAHHFISAHHTVSVTPSATSL
jgi:hypothetical protein